MISRTEERFDDSVLSIGTHLLPENGHDEGLRRAIGHRLRVKILGGGGGRGAGAVVVGPGRTPCNDIGFA